MTYRKYDAQEVINRIAMCADHMASLHMASLAGVGAMETAGAILGYLAKHPKDLEPFMVGGLAGLPPDFPLLHDLSWCNNNGDVIDPEHARRQIKVNAMKKASA